MTKVNRCVCVWVDVCMYVCASVPVCLCMYAWHLCMCVAGAFVLIYEILEQNTMLQRHMCIEPRQKYVDLQVDMVFSRSVKHQFRKFERGFSKGCPSPEWRMFLPDQLMTLLKGEEVFNWDDLRQVRHPSLTLQIHQTPQD